VAGHDCRRRQQASPQTSAARAGQPGRDGARGLRKPSRRTVPGEFDKLRILVLDAYDLALSKLERNAEIDVEDVKHLARAAKFDLDVLADRYRKELRPFLTGPEAKHDLTLELWIETIKEQRAQGGA